MPESVESKASKYLAEGRVVLNDLYYQSNAGHVRLTFYVQGSDTEPYYVKARRESGDQPWDWTCDCPARVPLCAHVVACKTILRDKMPVTKAVPTEDPDISKILGV